MHTLDVIREILDRNNNILEIRFFKYELNNLLQDRLEIIGKNEAQIIDKAIEEKNTHNVGFWEALFRVSAKNLDLSYELITQGLHHNINKDYLTFTRDNFDSCSQLLKDNFAINSFVKMKDGTEKHILMLDFDIQSKKENVILIQTVLRAMNLSGYILESGNSYHFISNNLVNEVQLINILAKFILLSPISDKSWASHQIIERSCSLRIGRKNGAHPRVISFL